MNSFDDVFTVGLTGQTGAGKTTVSKVFADKGFKVIDADIIARVVVEKGKPCLKELQNFFGNDIINDDQALNRSRLAEIVFSDKNKLELLDSVIYPYITSEILNRIRKYSESEEKLILLDAPTLFESRTDSYCEIIVSVVSDEKNRLERIIKRDNITRESAKKRMDSQLDQEFFQKNSDYIIENNGNLTEFYNTAKETADKIKKYYLNNWR